MCSSPETINTSESDPLPKTNSYQRSGNQKKNISYSLNSRRGMPRIPSHKNLKIHIKSYGKLSSIKNTKGRGLETFKV